MGGAKISDKILIIERLLDKVNHLIIGGGCRTPSSRPWRNIGKCWSRKVAGLCERTHQEGKAKNVELHLPIDSVIATNLMLLRIQKLPTAMPSGGLDGPGYRAAITPGIFKSDRGFQNHLMEWADGRVRDGEI